MARMSAFGPRRTFISTSSTPLTEENYFNLGGLNLYAPDELMPDNESPYARNFRIFKDDDIESRVCVSKRNGHTRYSTPVGETDRGNITSTTGAAEKDVYSIYQYAQKFTVSAAGRLTRVSINVKNDSVGTAPLLVDIYSDTDGKPATKLASSSISQTSIASTFGYVDVRFVEAPAVATSTDYWIVIHQQSEGTGAYTLSSNTSATTALYSADGGNNWATTDYALNYHVYVSTLVPVFFKRFYTSTAAPITLLVAGTTLYSVNESTGALTSISTALSASATDYKWVTVQNKIYFVNGVDNPKVYDGSTLADLGGSPGVSIDICLHKDRLWLLDATNKIIFSEPADYDNFGVTSFLYAPSPQSQDSALRIIPFQDNIAVLTRNSKYIISGSDISTITLRESTATTGLAGSNAAWKDGNYIYFVSKDGSVNIFNGGSDSDTSLKVDRALSNVADLKDVQLIIHDGKIRIYYATSGSGVLNSRLIYDMGYKQWMQDDEVYIGSADVFNSQTDENVLIEASSIVGVLYYGETGESDLGKPILFDYWTKYFSFKHPSRKHRIKRLYPYFNAGSGPYYITVGVDANEANSPVETQVYLGASGSTWGGGDTWGSGEVWGGSVLEPTRISVPGQARKHQIRFTQHGVDNPVEILGYSIYTITRKPI